MAKIDVFTIRIPALGRDKTIRVLIPDGLAKNDRRPVLYMQDGHNLFDPATSAYGASWNVHRAIAGAVRRGLRVPFVVGIDCPSAKRFDEYSPWVQPDMETFIPGLGRTSFGGEGDAYVDWIADVLKPIVDARYPTLPESTWIAGSSMGGLISLHAACRRPETFRKVGAFSPAVWFARTPLLEELSAAFPKTASCYVDIGTAETSDGGNPAFPALYLDGARAVRDALRSRGVKDLRYVEEQGAPHHESAWERRFPGFLEWLVRT